MLNLLEDCCYPVIRKDGTCEKVSFSQITGQNETNPVISFQTPRRDFDAALLQLFIGLLQTTLAPPTPASWLKRFQNPPERDELQAAVAPLVPYFKLTGPGPCFMQDLELSETDGEPKPISALLIEAPGENTLKNNTDHFIKRGTVTRISPFYTALALFTLNVNAPSGGQGHRTSLRGGGPLSTLVLGNTLWETLWLAVLDKPSFLGNGGPEQEGYGMEDHLAWCKPTNVSKKNGTERYPTNTSLLHCYWAMPRRIRLLAPEHQHGICDLSGEEGDTFFSGFVTLNYGNNYGDGWHHPLSPYYEDKTNISYSIKGQPDGIGWRHQAGMVFQTSKPAKIPARVVSAFRSRARRLPGPRSQHMRLHVFGYDMDNMKARSWLDQVMPVVFPCEPEKQGPFSQIILCFVQTADSFSSVLRQQYMIATSRLGKKAHGDFSFVRDRFWQETEPLFQEYSQILSALEEINLHKEAFVKKLFDRTISLFDQLTAIRAIETANPQQIMKARQSLIKYTSPRGKKVRELMELPLIEEPVP